jgi:hypothetical protein
VRRALFHINIFMNKYVATVRVMGQSVRTMVFADSPLHARLMLEYQFGIGSVIHNPSVCSEADQNYTPLEELINEVKSIKPMTPQQARIDSLKRQKDIASKNLKAERDRQKIAKAQQQLRLAQTQKPAS